MIAALLVAPPLHASAADVTSSSWWPGNGNATDVAGNQPGTLVNGTSYAAGRVGQGFNFDGIDDHVTFGNVAGNVGAADFTLGFWLKTTSSGRHEGIIAKRPACSHGSMFDVRLDPWGKVYVELDGSTGGTDYNFLRSTRSVNDGAFHHVAVVRKGKSASLYVDGLAEVTKSTAGTTNISNSTNLMAGKSPCTGIDGTQHFRGVLDEIVLGPDRDADGYPNVADNCPSVANAAQGDADGDGTGDACADPAPPSAADLAPADGASFITSTPTLSATFDDPNRGDDGYVEFEVYDGGGLVATNAGGSPVFVQPGERVTWQVPGGALQGGRTYTWRARAFDGAAYSAWTSNPAARTLTTAGTYPTVDQWNADQQTGRVDYSFRVNASALNAPGELAGPCYGIGCSWRVEARHSNGGAEQNLGTIASGSLAADTASMNETVSGVLWMEVTDIRTIVEPGSCYGCSQARTRYDSGWIRVAQPYATGGVALSVNTWERDAGSGSYAFDLELTAHGAAQFGGPCAEKACQWKVEARYDTGIVGSLGSERLPMGTWTLGKSLGGTISGGKITDVKGTLESMCDVTLEYWCWNPHEIYTTGWIEVSDLMVQDEDLRGYEAALSIALVASPSTFCDRLALAGGALPSVDGESPPDAWQRCVEAIQLYGPNIRKVLLFVAGAAGGALALDMLLDEHVNEGPVPTPEEEASPLPPWTPPDGWEDNGCHWRSIQYTAASEQHLKERGHIYEYRKTGKSWFYKWVNLKSLAENHAFSEMPEPDPTNSLMCRRVVTHLSKDVGFDTITAQSTNIYTVVTWKNTGEVHTMFPGLPR